MRSLACPEPCVAKLVQIFSKTTAAVFCTIVAHKLVHCLHTPVNGCWLQRTIVILSVDSSSTAGFAHPVIFTILIKCRIYLHTVTRYTCDILTLYGARLHIYGCKCDVDWLLHSIVMLMRGTLVSGLEKIVCTFEDNSCSFEDDLDLKERWIVFKSTVSRWDNSFNIGV